MISGKEVIAYIDGLSVKRFTLRADAAIFRGEPVHAPRPTSEWSLL
jgi:hypothetical protein